MFFSTSIAKLHYEWQLYPHQEQKYKNIQTWRALIFFPNIFFTFDDLLIQITDTRWSDLVPANNKHNTHFTNGKTIYIMLLKMICVFLWNIHFVYMAIQHYPVCCTSSDLRVEVNGQPFDNICCYRRKYCFENNPSSFSNLLSYILSCLWYSFHMFTFRYNI